MEHGHLQPSLDARCSGNTVFHQGDSSTDSCCAASAQLLEASETIGLCLENNWGRQGLVRQLNPVVPAGPCPGVDLWWLSPVDVELIPFFEPSVETHRGNQLGTIEQKLLLHQKR